MKTNLKSKISTTIAEYKSYGLNKTRPNEYITLRGLMAYSVGGIGVNSILSLFSYMTLAANCVLIGSVYGIKPTHLAYMTIIINIFSLIKAPIVSMIVDNTNTKYGKFRPLLIIAGVPAAIATIAMTWIPLDATYWVKCICIGVVYLFLFTFESIYIFAYQSLGQVMTSNSNERGKLISISQLIGNSGPSLINIIVPVFAGIISKDENGLLDINTYRILFPIIAVIAILLTIWTFKDTEEKIIVPKKYVAKVKFKEGVSQIARNKYFWIITSAEVLGILRQSISFAFLGWYCVYLLNSDSIMAVVSTVMGTAVVPGMLLAPVISRKIGKRNFQLISYSLHVVFAILMAVFYHNSVMFFILMYLCIFTLGGDFVTTQSMWGDTFDFQQYQTGKRLEGFILQFKEFIMTFCGFGTCLILPYLYEYNGLLDDYSVLYNPEVRDPIFMCIIFATAISTALAIIPYIFYDLTSEKHEKMIEELKIRAKQDDELVG